MGAGPHPLSIPKCKVSSQCRDLDRHFTSLQRCREASDARPTLSASPVSSPPAKEVQRQSVDALRRPFPVVCVSELLIGRRWQHAVHIVAEELRGGLLYWDNGKENGNNYSLKYIGLILGGYIMLYRCGAFCNISFQKWLQEAVDALALSPACRCLYWPGPLQQLAQRLCSMPPVGAGPCRQTDCSKCLT